MQSLTKEYLLLFNAITDAETLLARLRADLIAAQQQAEALFLEGGEDVSQEDHPPSCRLRGADGIRSRRPLVAFIRDFSPGL